MLPCRHMLCRCPAAATSCSRSAAASTRSARRVRGQTSAPAGWPRGADQPADHARCMEGCRPPASRPRRIPAPLRSQLSAVDLERPEVVERLFELFHGSLEDDSLPEQVRRLAGCWDSLLPLCTAQRGTRPGCTMSMPHPDEWVR